MKHTLRKYLSSRGSALFMVLSTMTALLIVVMAMYFSVVSSRSVQYAVFNREQSYQSAVSIQDALIAGLKDGGYAQQSELMSALAAMDEGDVITTNGNGYKTFSSSGTKEDDDQIGAYNVEIKRLNDMTINGQTNMVFDIATTTSVNGVTEVVHSQVYVQITDNDSPPMRTEAFASTGYVPNDVYLDGGNFDTDVFFDNEYTYISAYNSGAMKLGGNLSAGGSVINNQYLHNGAPGATTWAIRNRYESLSRNNEPVKLKNGSVVFIGGDFVLNSGGFDIYDTGKIDIYVGGNLYVNMSSVNFKNCNLYVNGDIIFSGSTWNSFGKVYLNGRLICDTVKEEWWPVHEFVTVHAEYDPKAADTSTNNLRYFGNQTNAFSSDGFKDGDLAPWDENAPGMSYIAAMTELNGRTMTQDYYKWVINDGTIEGYTYTEAKKLKSYVKELDEDGDMTNNVTLCYNLTNKDYIHADAIADGYAFDISEINNSYNNVSFPTIPAFTFTHTLAYSASCKGAIIEDVICAGGMPGAGAAKGKATVVIDTGEDPNNVFTIRVKANRDIDGDGVNETFSWYPVYNNGGSAYLEMLILVKGRGTVVVDIPEGVTYQDSDRQDFLHYGWFLLLGGSDAPYIDAGGGSHEYYETVDFKGTDTIKYIHQQCGSAGDTCSYTDTSSGEKCAICKGNLKEVYCSEHDYTIQYCPTCYPDVVNRDDSGNPKGNCNSRVDRKAVDTFLASNSSIKAKMTGSDGKTIYPNTNIFLVSIDESSSIRLSQNADGSYIMENSFFGYIYAPYMTFKGKDDGAAGDYVRLCGGLTVSDYVINGNMAYLACWPEKMPSDLMGDECFQNKLDGAAAKSWKVGVLTH